jgi:beta-lactamase regulating signal transducer with metallopeptidase domain
MMERAIEYLTNAVWQFPLLAVGAWWLLRAAKVGPLGQHRVWIAVLGLGVLLPLARVGPETVVVRSESSASVLAGAGVERVVMAASADVAQVRPGRVNVSWAKGLVTQGWLRRHSVQVSASAARWLAGIYLAAVLLGLLRIVRGWGTARRLVREGQEVVLGDRGLAMLEECGQMMGVGLPRVLESDEVSSPAVVGVRTPVLLLPEAFEGYSEDEMRAALLHELAHIRRRDYAANALCEMAALPLAWHPAMGAVRRRIRGTREMVCDAIAAGEMGSAMVYARSLLTLAGKTLGGVVEGEAMAVGLFTNNNLEERVMQLTDMKQALGMRARMVRVMSAAAGMVAVLALAEMVHVTPAVAQTAAVAPQAAPSVGEAQAAAAPAAAVTGQSVPPEDVAKPVVQAAQSSESAGAATSVGAGTSAGQGTSVGQSRSADEDTSGGAGMSASEPVAIAHGDHARVEMGRETYNVHRWKGADGKPFVILNHEKAEPTVEEQRRFEQEFKDRMGDVDGVVVEELKLDELGELQGLAEAQRQMAEAKLESVEVQRQLTEVNSPEFKKQMAEQMAELKQQMGALKLDKRDLKVQLDKLDSGEIQKQMAELDKQMALSKLDSAEVQKQMDKLSGPEFQKELDEQLKEAREQMELARKQIDEQLKVKVVPDAKCTEPCNSNSNSNSNTQPR